MSPSRLDRWLAPRIAARATDAEREIADDPTEVAWFRGSVELAHIVVRITDAASSAFTTQRGQYSAGTAANVFILASAGTDLRAKDRLQKEGGETWVLSAVSPDRATRTEAIGEVVSR